MPQGRTPFALRRDHAPGSCHADEALVTPGFAETGEPHGVGRRGTPPPGGRRMLDPDLAAGSHRKHLADGFLVLALALLAFLLGCYELSDTDVWWHLRSGRWILEHRGVPRLDPFTFASSDRAWIDLHWGFQVVLAMAYALGGVAGMILLASSAAASALTILVTARRRSWPAWVVALCWLPALALMATRFDPRPEVFSLVFLASFLAILLRVEDRPALCWALPPIQALWVNTHGLFILGPIVLGCYWLDRLAWDRAESRRRSDGPARERPAIWRHLAPASVAVILATLANPYGIRGTLLPLELLPKIADPQPLQVVHRRVRRPARGGSQRDGGLVGSSFPHSSSCIPLADDRLELPGAGRLADPAGDVRSGREGRAAVGATLGARTRRLLRAGARLRAGTSPGRDSALAREGRPGNAGADPDREPGVGGPAGRTIARVGRGDGRRRGGRGGVGGVVAGLPLRRRAGSARPDRSRAALCRVGPRHPGRSSGRPLGGQPLPDAAGRGLRLSLVPGGPQHQPLRPGRGDGARVEPGRMGRGSSRQPGRRIEPAARRCGDLTRW